MEKHQAFKEIKYTIETEEERYEYREIVVLTKLFKETYSERQLLDRIEETFKQQRGLNINVHSIRDVVEVVI